MGDNMKLFFCRVEDMDKYSKEIPNPKIGCTSSGQLGIKFEDKVSLIELESSLFSTEVVRVDNIKAPLIYAEEIVEKAKAVKVGKKHLVCVVLNDGLAGTEELMQITLKNILPDGTDIVGGSNADNLEFKWSACCIDNDVYRGTCVLLIGTNLNYSVNQSSMFKVLDKSAIVTRAKNRTLYELDGKPAAKVYADMIGVSVDELASHTYTNPLGRVFEGGSYIASTKKINKDGSIEFYCAVTSGIKFNLMQEDGCIEQLDELTRHVKSTGKPYLSLVFDCIFRRLHYVDNNIGNLVMRKLGEINGKGFTTFGEQLGGWHFNQSMSLITFYK